jgi:hypothetical protein
MATRQDQVDRVVEQVVAPHALGHPHRVLPPLVPEHQVDVAQRQRRQRLLGLPVDHLAAQPRRLAREPSDRGQRDLQRDGFKAGDPPPAGDGARCGGQVRLGERGALEQRLGVVHQHKCRVGEAHAAPGPLQQRHAGLALEHGELLRHRRRGELERVGDRRDRPPLVQLAQEAEAAERQHREAMLLNERQKSESMLTLGCGRIDACALPGP